MTSSAAAAAWYLGRWQAGDVAEQGVLPPATVPRTWNQPLTIQECGQRRWALRAVNDAPTCPGADGDPEDTPPVGARQRRLRVLAAFARDNTMRLELLGSGTRGLRSARLLRRSRVDHPTARLHGLDRRRRGLDAGVPSADRTQEPLVVLVCQEDAVGSLEGRVTRLSTALVDVEAERVAGVLLVARQRAPLRLRDDRDRAADACEPLPRGRWFRPVEGVGSPLAAGRIAPTPSRPVAHASARYRAFAQRIGQSRV